MVILAGCSAKSNDEAKDSNKITAEAIAKIYRSCKYTDGNFCGQECCISNSKCGEREAYRQCDLETGYWKNESFADAKCSLKCFDYLKEGEPVVEKNTGGDFWENIKDSLQKCNQSWICSDNFNLKFQLMNCSIVSAVYCERGCKNNSCVPLCRPGDLICRANTIRKCDEDGNYYSYVGECRLKCENGICINNQSDVNSTNETASINQTSQINDTGNQTQNATQPAPGQNNDYISDKCISVVKFNYTGGANATDEYFTLKNGCAYSISLEGWTAKDESKHIFTFPSFNFGASAEISVVTGTGLNTAASLYWNRGSPVWNNDKDTLYLNDSMSQPVLTYSYP